MLGNGCAMLRPQLPLGRQGAGRGGKSGAPETTNSRVRPSVAARGGTRRERGHQTGG